MALCDRIMVLCGGRMNGILDGRTATKEEVGLLMTKLQNTEEKLTESEKGKDGEQSE